jgi:hypothetical protein
MVKNAGWFPSYDIRAKSIQEPVQLVYKANVKQDTKVDWSNVKLKFSSATPNLSNITPELQTYYLNYNALPPNYKRYSNQVNGRVLDQAGEPLPGVNVLVEGTTIGTVTDVDGSYSLTVPNNAKEVTYSFIGFNSQTLPIIDGPMNVALDENAMALNEVVVTGYGSINPLKSLAGRVAGITTKKEKDKITIRGMSSLAIPTAKVENQTSVNFEIKTPYSIPSDSKNYAVEMERYELPASYQYYCVPKVDRDAFLLAYIVDWEKYSLLEGEANVFFENTYVGKTLLDVRFASDTLELSLGRDKQVSVNREKMEEYTDKQFIGNKKEDARAWKISVKNNKSQAINMIVLDQVPVSSMDEIEVDVRNISGAKHHPLTGEVKWELNLESSERKEFDLQYSVKYPKYKNLYLE